MFNLRGIEKRSWSYRWPVTLIVVATILAGMQLLRVNRPRSNGPSEPQTIYSAEGPVVVGQITIPAREYYSRRIDLNHRSKLIGSFKTPNVRSRVSVIVMIEQEFERWKTGAEFRTLAQTGLVPGGKVNPVLEPGIYFLVIDNSQSETAQPVDVDFRLE